jgi:hypothetical protein
MWPVRPYLVQVIRYPLVMVITWTCLPGLKNMYRIVAVFLWTLNGCPERVIRLAIILEVSGFIKLPVATRCGAGGINSFNQG